MNKFILSAAVALAIPAAAFADDKIVNPDSTGFQFTDVEIVFRTNCLDKVIKTVI